MHISLDIEKMKALVMNENNVEMKVQLNIQKTRGGLVLEIPENIFGVLNILPIELFEQYISDKLTLEQEVTLYNNWGRGFNIIISTTAYALGIEKSMVRSIIAEGMKYNILCQGTNNTYKIVDPKIIKDRWVDKAKQLSKPMVEKQPMTIKEVTKQFDEMSKTFEEEVVEPIKRSEIQRLRGNKVVSQKEFIKDKHPQQDSSVLEDLTEDGLRAQLKQLEIKKDTYTGWDKNYSVHDVVNEINAVKRKLQIFDNARAAEAYKEEMSTPGFSIVSGLQRGEKSVGQPIPLSKAKLLIKKKPLPGKPLGKK
jgi:hypothetical protein